MEDRLVMDAVCDNCSEYFDPKVIEEICDKCFSEDMNNRKSLHIKFASIQDLKQNVHVQELLETMKFYANQTNWSFKDIYCFNGYGRPSISDDDCARITTKEYAEFFGGKRARAKLTEWGL